jgi:cyclophilin family peptidyl-prolyl cis-trans isomerase/FKBP-type peptidyl-prolyl cis-trans isomerase
MREHSLAARRGRLAVCLLAVSGLLVAACGDDENLEPVLDTNTVAPATASAASTVPGSDTADTGDASSAGTTVPGASEKPEVQIPAELPTELVITDLVEGTGEPAKDGDTVTVNYVGVRSADGTEFDNSYDRGSPFPVTLGSNSVIPGWEQGLIGVKEGGRRQLDIPADLAYGDSGAGDVIQPGDALSFVIDVVSIEFAPPEPTLAPQADAADCPATDGSEAQQQEFSEYPPTCIDVTKTYTAEIVTNLGAMTVELYADRAPITVNSFVTLARYKYFDGISCHRIIPGFVAQCGDPTGTGSGGPGYEFADELPEAGEYQIGSFAMANAGPNTNGSQFFIITGDQGVSLPPDYSLFGMVTEGLDTTVPALDAVGNPDGGVPPLEEVTIESITITES